LKHARRRVLPGIVYCKKTDRVIPSPLGSRSKPIQGQALRRRKISSETAPRPASTMLEGSGTGWVTTMLSIAKVCVPLSV
jgi:hypothetical protein